MKPCDAVLSCFSASQRPRIIAFKPFNLRTEVLCECFEQQKSSAGDRHHRPGGHRREPGGADPLGVTEDTINLVLSVYTLLAMALTLLEAWLDRRPQSHVDQRHG